MASVTSVTLRDIPKMSRSNHIVSVMSRKSLYIYLFINKYIYNSDITDGRAFNIHNSNMGGWL